MHIIILIMSTTLRVAVSGDDLLGEGPCWDDLAGLLSWVDIKSRRVLRWSPGQERPAARSLPDEVSLCLPTADGRRVVAQVDRLALDDGTTLTDLCEIDAANEHTRLNDACCDDLGRLWVGTYSTRGEAESGVYRVSPDGVAVQVLDGLVAANGLGWTPDGAAIYVTDTGRCRVDRYTPGDAEAPWLVREGTLLVDDGRTGRPDGLAVDRE